MYHEIGTPQITVLCLRAKSVTLLGLRGLIGVRAGLSFGNQSPNVLLLEREVPGGIHAVSPSRWMFFAPHTYTRKNNV